MRKLITALEELDADAASYSLRGRAATIRIVQVLTVVCLSLYLLDVMQSGNSFVGAVRALEGIGVLPKGVNSVRYSADLELFQMCWWVASIALAYVTLPLAFQRFFFRGSIKALGLGWADTWSHRSSYLRILCLLVPGAIAASFAPSFAEFYPMYRMAGTSWLHLLTWELLYMIQFIGIEFFYRGFMLNTLRPAQGASSIFVMSAPYLMIHLGKPLLEPLVAFCFGVLAGVLALRSKSIWGGVIMHVSVAWTMDFCALAQRGGLPQKFLP